MECPQCHAQVASDAAFCPYCGLALGSATQATAPSSSSTPNSNRPYRSYPTSPSTLSQQAAPSTPFGLQPTTPPMMPPYGAAPASQPLMPPPYGAASQPYAPPPSQSLGTSPYAAPPSQPYMAPPPGMGTSASGSQVLTNLLGPDANPAQAQPSTHLQGFFLRNLPRNYAVNRWITAIIGAICALGIGLLLTAIVQSLWSSALNDAFSAASSTAIGDVFSGLAQGVLTPDVLKLFAIAHHVPLTISSNGASATINIPLTGLLIIPAIGLTVGGYLSAASDYQRQPRSSILRGMLIAPFYAVLTAVFALFATSTSSSDLFGASVSVSVGPSAFAAFLYGLLWALIFGALGGWIQLRGKAWISTALGTLQTVRHGRIAGALAGAVSAYISGVLIATIVAACAYSFLSTHTAATTTITSSQLQSGGATHGLAALLIVIFTLAPTAGIWIFSLATGASLDTFASAVTGGSGTTSNSIGFIGAQHQFPSGVWYLLMIIPFISYLIGGRISAQVARASRVDEAFIAGAFMAVPLSIIMAVMALFTSVSLDAAAAGQTFSAGVTISAGGVFLCVLIIGAVVGGIGGASTRAFPGLGSVLLLPFSLLGLMVAPLVNALSGAGGKSRSVARRWVDTGVALAIILAIIVVVLAIISNQLANVLPFNVLSLLLELAGVLLVGLPALYFVGALITSFTNPRAQQAGALVSPVTPAIPIPAMAGNVPPYTPYLPYLPYTPSIPNAPYAPYAPPPGQPLSLPPTLPASPDDPTIAAQ